MKTLLISLLVLGALVVAPPARAQNLLEQAAGSAPAQPEPAKPGATPPPGAAPAAPPGAAIPGAPATQHAAAPATFSLFAVTAPRPKTYAKHDLVELIINESSLQKFEQTADLKKNYGLKAELSKFPSLRDLLMEAALNEGIGATKPGIGLSNDSKYKGEGKFNRKDQITAKITATVIDVKPNGNLVLEARESIQSDKEISTMVISGVCRAEDITKSNTLQSSQLANMNLRIEHDGDVKDTAEKGLIPRIFETIFNF